MAKNTNRTTTSKKSNGRQEKSQIYVDELYFRHVDQVERWRREVEHYQTVESKLLDVSRFYYEAFDYTPLLTRTIFQEKPIPDYSYMVKDAQIAAESKFFVPISVRILFLVTLLFLLIVGTDRTLLWISGAGILVVILSLILMIQERKEYIQKAILLAEGEIEKRITYAKKKIADEKKAHESKEDERIKSVEEILAGEISPTFSKIEVVLSRLAFFFDISGEINVYNNIPSVKIWLPSKSIIPTTLCTVEASGRPTFSEKEVRTINKQYLELCAGILMNVMCTIYSHIPSFDLGYIYGLSKETASTECLIAIKVHRDSLISASNAGSGLEGIQRLKAKFYHNTALELLPMELEEPEEWKDVEQKLIRRLQVNLFRN